MRQPCKSIDKSSSYLSTVSLFNSNNDVRLPMGPAQSTNIVNSKGYTLNYNEYIVYDTRQVRMRYLIQLKFHFT
jgi:hypothetical protein